MELCFRVVWEEKTIGEERRFRRWRRTMVREEGGRFLDALRREQQRLFDDITALDEDYEAGRIDKKTHDRASATQREELTEIQRRIDLIHPQENCEPVRCLYCGSENPEGKRYCGECGQTLPGLPSRVDAHAVSGRYPVHYRGRVRTGYLLGGGLTAAVFFGLFYWSTTYTWTEQVWHPVPYIGGYWTTETQTVDPAIQAFLLVIAIIGLLAVTYGAIARR